MKISLFTVFKLSHKIHVSADHDSFIPSNVLQLYKNKWQYIIKYFIFTTISQCKIFIVWKLLAWTVHYNMGYWKLVHPQICQTSESHFSLSSMFRRPPRSTQPYVPHMIIIWWLIHMIIICKLYVNHMIMTIIYIYSHVIFIWFLFVNFGLMYIYMFVKNIWLSYDNHAIII